MNTAMSSRRVFVVPESVSKPKNTTGMWLNASLAFIGGLFLMAVGVMLDNRLPAAAGFGVFAIGFLQLNNMFWAKIYGSRKLVSQKWINRNY